MIPRGRAYVSLSLIFSMLFSPLGIPLARADQKTFLKETQDEINGRLVSAKQMMKLPLYWHITLIDSDSLLHPNSKIEDIEALRNTKTETIENLRAMAADDIDKVQRNEEENRQKDDDHAYLIGFGSGGSVGLLLGGTYSKFNPVRIDAPIIFGNRIVAIAKAEMDADREIEVDNLAIELAENEKARQAFRDGINKTVERKKLKIAAIETLIQEDIKQAAKLEVRNCLLHQGRMNLSEMINWDLSERSAGDPLWANRGELTTLVWSDGTKTAINGDWKNLFEAAEKAESGPLKEVKDITRAFENLFQSAYEKYLEELLAKDKSTLADMLGKDRSGPEVWGKTQHTVLSEDAQEILRNHFGNDLDQVVNRIRKLHPEQRDLTYKPQRTFLRAFRPKAFVEAEEMVGRRDRYGRLAEGELDLGGSILTVTVTTALSAFVGYAYSTIKYSSTNNLDHIRDGDIPWNKTGNISDKYVGGLVNSLSKILPSKQILCGSSEENPCTLLIPVPSSYLEQANAKKNSRKS